MISWLRETMLAEGKICAADLDLLTITDSPIEVRDRILDSARRESSGPEKEARRVKREALAKNLGPDHHSEPDA